jgi:hypothetical protein
LNRIASSFDGRAQDCATTLLAILPANQIIIAVRTLIVNADQDF